MMSTVTQAERRTADSNDRACHLCSRWSFGVKACRDFEISVSLWAMLFLCDVQILCIIFANVLVELVTSGTLISRLQNDTCGMNKCRIDNN